MIIKILSEVNRLSPQHPADETERSARAHNKLPIYRGFFNSSKEAVTPPVDLLPPEFKRREVDGNPKRSLLLPAVQKGFVTRIV
ncbi:MAG: hypothetical protein M1470_14965 [Bacteroidetes bacterium]|nr:hypothetical protein [Bacteroidota bacterium]MCL5737506.1 hypothetical protein [Bacteroidota bacterium]